MAARDVMFIAVIVFSLGIAFLIAHLFLSSVVTQITLIPTVNESSASLGAFQSMVTLSNRFDYIIFGVFIGCVLGMIISAWFVGGHPIFMFAYFCVAAITVVISTILANTWETVSTSSAFGTTVSHFPLTNHLLNYLPIYAGVIGFIGLVVMFGKPLLQGAQNG